MKIKFLEDRLVKDVTGTLYKQGEVYDLSESSAAHWISRGVAVKVGPASKAVKPRIETATARAPETTQSANVPLPYPPPRQGDPLSVADYRGKDGGE